MGRGCSTNGKARRKEAVGRLGCRRVDNNKIDLMEVELDYIN
jgi:hypothetical protein